MLKITLFLLAIYYVQCIPLALEPEILDDDDQIPYEDETEKNIRSIIGSGMEISDPIILNRVDANLATLNYSLTNVNVTGFGKCLIKSAEIDKEALSLKVKWECPNFRFLGQYQTKGKILILPIEGQGDLDVRTGKFTLVTTANLVELKDKHGRPHLKIKNFSLSRLNFLQPITYQLTNLFNGDKALAEEALKFLNDNWRDVADVIKDPAVTAWVKVALKHVNEFLKPEPVDKILS